jgi:hypothetical protein
MQLKNIIQNWNVITEKTTVCCHLESISETRERDENTNTVLILSCTHRHKRHSNSQLYWWWLDVNLATIRSINVWENPRGDQEWTIQRTQCNWKISLITKIALHTNNPILLSYRVPSIFKRPLVPNGGRQTTNWVPLVNQELLPLPHSLNSTRFLVGFALLNLLFSVVFYIWQTIIINC